MSCSCNCNPCQCTECDPDNEPLSSALNNFIVQFFGSLTKTCINNEIVWVLPCDLSAGAPGLPRLPGEGLACYFLRIMAPPVGISGTQTVVTNVRYESPNIFQTKQSFTFTNGVLTATGTPVESIVATAEACT